MEIDFSSINRILVAKLRHHGDVLLSAPVFSLLKKRFPHLEIDAYIYSETLPMLEGHPAISNFILYNKGWKKLPLFKRYREELKLLKKIRKGRYDLVINLTEGDRGAVAAKISRAPYAIGFDPQGGGMRGKANCYTHLIKHTPRPRHTVEKQLDALRVLGIFPTLKERELTFHIPAAAREKIAALLPENYVHIHPVSRWMFKTLPIETLVAVIHYLQERGEQVVLTASSDPAEMEMNAQLASQAPGVIDLSGQLSLKELGAVIEKSRLLITVDSVPLHLASVFKKEVVAIFGPTCDQNWGPWQNPHARVVTLPLSCRPCYQPGCGGSGQSDCLLNLPTAPIITAAHELLEQAVTV
ncbi:putative lipopolysaccharide heptosyltransferase III [Candidatus Neptunochlamydia vexilliferae]|uniref:Lipopolysaccharide core heptosyltransferase RfaQ n=1 Tax=Candidatus Neptunichlamydia vexilliferae TaxID=1651774 RepID=A0ABS0AZ13_9BACT|nr:putative lipopolysaccharide heptosyltransferase III [Candidatus Neptunochlamydia vexilliferae]MBF5059351.1 Lipopolysaccharide core heptosyltransferase RfaQ [Candidatus Neptunochlamydia vexilliferae]